MTEFLQRIETGIVKRRLLVRGETVLVAVSGGVDSMVLLDVLSKLSAAHRWKLTVAHFNHRLRGRASDADERLVRKIAAKLKLPVIVESADVKKFAAKSKLSIETAARKLRHEFFARVARERKIKTLALAHHADDQVELFFLRLLRGAGTEGLAGMKWQSPSPADKNLRLIRPLLDCSKPELHAYARHQKISFRDDATNFSADFLRNRIRNELIPLLKTKYQPGLDKTILRAMDILGAEAEALSGVAENIRTRRREPGLMKSMPFPDLSRAIQRRLLQSQLAGLGIAGDFDLVEALRENAGKEISVASGINVVRPAAGDVKLISKILPEFQLDETTVKLSKAGEMFFGGINIAWKICSGSRGGPPRRLLSEFFDADEVGDAAVLRHWRPGDRFHPIGFHAAVKLQDFFVNAKVPRELRHKLIVAVTVAGEVFWVEGLRIGEKFKLTPATKRTLVWRWNTRRFENLAK